MENYQQLNRENWNARTEAHYDSEFYDVKGFLDGNTSLKEPELSLLGDINGLSLLHLQCHFGQDTLSLARMGAAVTGTDLSNNAIHKAHELAAKAGIEAHFVCCDLYDLPLHLKGSFDVVFTSYGTIGWLPDLDRWAAVITHFLKPGGKFIMADFHPVVWMWDDDFREIAYNYFNTGPIVENSNGTYTDRDAPIRGTTVGWNHSTGELLNALTSNGLSIKIFNEYNYSPYNCFARMIEFEKGKFRLEPFGDKLPIVYALHALKNTQR